MNNFNLHTPTRILFGKGAIAGLREQIPHDARVLITYGGGSVKKTGVLDQVLDALKGHGLEAALDAAVRVSAFVCTRPGAMPELPEELGNLL